MTISAMVGYWPGRKCLKGCECGRHKPASSPKPDSRAAYMREHRKTERELIKQAKAAGLDPRKKEQSK